MQSIKCTLCHNRQATIVRARAVFNRLIYVSILSGSGQSFSLTSYWMLQVHDLQDLLWLEPLLSQGLSQLRLSILQVPTHDNYTSTILLIYVDLKHDTYDFISQALPFFSVQYWKAANRAWGRGCYSYHSIILTIIIAAACTLYEYMCYE